MPIIAKEPESQAFRNIETGVYQAVCAEVVDLGMRESSVYGKPDEKTTVHKVSFVFELSELRDDGKPFTMCREYRLSLHEKATLRKDLDAWRGKAFTEDELKGFDVEKVTGANCMVTVSAYTKNNGHDGRKITSVGKCMKGLAPMVRSADYVRPKFLTDMLTEVDAPAPSAESEPPFQEDDLPF